MLWFGPKQPCLHCGRDVRKIRDLDKFLCPHCGEPGPWATPEQVDAWRIRTDARRNYHALLANLSTGGADAAQALVLRDAAHLCGYSEEERRELGVGAYVGAAKAAITDGLLTPEENSRLWGLLAAVQVTWDDVARSHPELGVELTIASANAGVLPTVTQPGILVKAGEVVHRESSAELIKEVTLREFQGGYQGFSFPIGNTGIRYRVGGARGHSVVVGTELKVEDGGTLSITSRRAVFVGARKTIELPYSKLVNLGVFSDGVQFHQSNRQSAPLFRLQNSEIIAAIVNAAAQRGESA